MFFILLWGCMISIASLFCQGHSKCSSRWVHVCFWLLAMKRTVWTATASSIVFITNSVKFLSATCHFQFMLSEILTMIDGTKLFSKFLLNQKLIPKPGCTQFFNCDDFFNKCKIIFMGSIRPFLDIQIFYSTLYIWHSYLPMWGKKKWTGQICCMKKTQMRIAQCFANRK